MSNENGFEASYPVAPLAPTDLPNPSGNGNPPAGMMFSPMENYPPPPYAAALLSDDPPKIGDFWLDARLGARASGVSYLAHGTDESPVMLIVLSQGAASDPAARDRLSGEVNKMHIDTVIARGGQGQDEGRLGHKYRSEDDDPVSPDAAPLAPWVALAYDGTMDAIAESDRILRSVDLSMTPTLGISSGPDYHLHWIDESQPGGWRLWPLPWPSRRDRAGWMTILVSFLLMLVLTALALLIVVLIFQNAPAESPSPPVPTNSQSQSSSSPQSQSPQSGSPSSASPSDGSGSPSESQSQNSGSPSQSSSSSPSASGDQSQSNSPSSSDGRGSPSKEPSMVQSGPSGSASGSRHNTKL